MPRTPAQTPEPVPPADPLADVRAEFGTTEAAGLTAPEAPAPPAVLPNPEAWGDNPEDGDVPVDASALVAQVITHWHDDDVATGFLHRGERCPCHYLATVAVASLLPEQGMD